VAHGTFYVHFTSKDDVLDELLGGFNDELAARLAPVLLESERAPLKTTVRRTAEIFLDYWNERRSFVDSYARRAAAGLDARALREGINPPMFALLHAAIQSRANERGAVGVDPALAAHALLAMWLRVGLQRMFNPSVTRKDAVDALVRMSVGAIDAYLTEPDKDV